MKTFHRFSAGARTGFGHVQETGKGDEDKMHRNVNQKLLKGKGAQTE